MNGFSLLRYEMRAAVKRPAPLFIYCYSLTIDRTRSIDASKLRRRRRRACTGGGG